MVYLMPQIQSAEKGPGRNKKKGRKQERERTKEGSFYYVTIHQEVYSPHPRKEPAPNPIRLSP